MRVGLFGPYSSSNLGDTATQIAAMANLRRVTATRLPNVRLEFIGIGSDPADIARTHGLRAFDMTGTELASCEPDSSDRSSTTESSRPRRFLPSRLTVWIDRLGQMRNIFRLSRNIDVLMVSGGGQLDDFWGGPWGRPFELIAWALACRIRRGRVIVFATGVDNLRTGLGTRMCVWAVRMAHYASLRDQWSTDFLGGKGLRGNLRTCPDAAFSLPVSESRTSPASNEPSRIIACPISERAWRHSSSANYDSYISEFVKLCVALLSSGHRVCLSNSQSGMDIPIVDKVEARVRASLSAGSLTHLAPGLEVRHALTVEDFVSLAASANVVIASRLHGAILPLAVGTPVVAISYMRKVSQVMTDMDLASYCVELDAVRAEAVVALVNSALEQSSELRARIADTGRSYRRDLELEYENIVGHLTS